MGELLQLADLGETVLELSDGECDAVGVEGLTGEGDSGEVFGGVLIEELVEGEGLGVLLGETAFGGVDDLLGGFHEIAFELAEVGHHLFVGEDWAVVDVFGAVEHVFVSNDAAPFHVFERVEAVEFGLPDFVDGRAGAVVEAF